MKRTRRMLALLAAVVAVLSISAASCYEWVNSPPVYYPNNETGYTGALADLHSVSGPTSTFPGCPGTWTPTTGGDYPGYWTVTGDCTADHVWVKGGIYTNSPGVDITLTNSIVSGGGGGWFIIAAQQPTGSLSLTSVTVQWKGNGYNTSVPNNAGAIQTNGPIPVTVKKTDISGNPDGLQVSGRTLVEDSWIHDLAENGSPPNNTHNEAIFQYAGDLTISRSLLDQTPLSQQDSNAAVFMQGDPAMHLHVAYSALNGGGYTLYCENGDVQWLGSQFGPDHLYGEKLTTGCTTAGVP